MGKLKEYFAKRRAKRAAIKEHKDLFKYKKDQIKEWKKEGFDTPSSARSKKKSARKTFKETKKEIRGYTDY